MGAPGRTLLYIPIVHTQTDMGELGNAVQRAAIRELGIKAWRHKMRAVDQVWTDIEQVLGTIQLHYEKVRLYQDGLPICGHEDAIVRELAGRGSRNHRLLLRLMDKGATIMGTESPKLLLREYERMKRSAVGPRAGPWRRLESEIEERDETLLDLRNGFIADRINTTLKPGETGILFLGMLHTLEDQLDRDIHVIHPMPRPDQ